jgi:hypothetical protein
MKFIVEKVDSQLYVEPTIIRMYNASFLRTGKSAAGTIFPQKVSGSQSPAWSFKPHFLAAQSTPFVVICFASSDNFVTFVTKNWVLDEQQQLSSNSDVIKVSLEVVHQLLDEINMVGNIFVSLHLHQKIGEEDKFSLEIILEKRQFLLKSPDCCYHVSHCAVPSLQINIQLIKVPSPHLLKTQKTELPCH